MNTSATEATPEATPDPYVANGCANRREYLCDLADDNDVPLYVVLKLARMLGPNEDFDGLVIAVEDYALCNY